MIRSFNEPDIFNIVSKAKAYDKEAFSMIYDLYYDRIYKYAYSKVGNRQTAEDITQNTFIGMLDNIKNFKWKKSSDGFSAWVFSIAHNMIVNYYRKHKQTVNIEEAPEKTVEFTDQIDTNYNIGKFKEAFKVLKDDHRKVLALRFISGQSIRETAAAMNKTEGAVKLLQLRAIGAIKRKFGGDLNE